MGLTFAAPLALLGLIALPAIYLLLRVTPPRPREIVFPPIRLLFELLRREETPARTPWQILALRLAIAGLAVLAMAGPAVTPTATASFSRAPLLIAIDDGWSAAPDFDARLEAARAIAADAARAGAAVAVLPMSEAEAAPAIEDGGKIDERLRALAPQPYLPDRASASARLAEFLAAHPQARLVWIADGLEQGGASEFAKALKSAAAAGAEVRTLTSAHIPRALVSPQNTAAGLEVDIARASSEAGSSGSISAYDAQGRVLAQASFDFGAGAKAKARFDLPIELRNEATLLRLDGEASAGAAALLDGRSKVRRVAVLSGASADLAQPLLEPQYYLEKAFAPFAEVRAPRPGAADPLPGLIAEQPNIVALADVGVLPQGAHEALVRFVEEGGVLLRFAGARLANGGGDGLTPVRLRRSGRVLGGAMSWDTPKKLAPFEPSSPFYGLTVPDEVTVTRQVLAEPEPGLPAKTWAALTDGTPLVTAERRGKGLIVLFHVSADAAWSNLPISGLFVDMLHRIAAESGAASARQSEAGARSDAPALAPLLTLDGRGRLRGPPPSAKPIPGDYDGGASRDHPPGFYGAADAPLAVQPLRPGDDLRAFDFAGQGLSVAPLRAGAPIDLRPFLLALVFFGFLADWLILLVMSGALRRAAPIAAGAICALAVLGAAPEPSRAKEAPSAASARDREAALTTRLAYVLSGDARVDETSRLGLEFLSRALEQRTSFAPGPPVGVDPARDELAFYPMLYWPIVATAPLPSAQAIARIGVYLKQGGTIVFDTRDALTAHQGGPPTPEAQWLRDLTRNLDIPPLEVTPRDHVITKTFYLLDGFYGRTINGKTWVEALPPESESDPARPVRATDSVSSVVITSNDLAGAWAADRNGQPLYTLTPGGARQRELAIRGGVNLVMYTLTGNYKSDQVHVRDLLERLGQ